MGVIHVDRLKKNMVLSEDVRDLNTRLLLARDLKIQSKHVRILKMWGITEVSVVTDEPDYEEKKGLGCKHTDIGRDLLKKWRIPFSIENNLFYHHNPSSANNQAHATIVHLADIIAHSLEIGTSGERFVPNFDHKAFDRLGISPSCFDSVIRRAMHQFNAIESFFK